MGEFTCGHVPGLKHVAEKWLEISVTDEIIQFPYSREVIVGFGIRMV